MEKEYNFPSGLRQTHTCENSTVLIFRMRAIKILTIFKMKMTKNSIPQTLHFIEFNLEKLNSPTYDQKEFLHFLDNRTLLIISTDIYVQ